MIFENIKIALASMIHNKLRTILSLLGIVIGVGSVVAILNLSESVTDSITASMDVGGIDMVSIFPTGSSRELNLFTEDFGDTLMRNISGIDLVLPSYYSTVNVRAGQETESCTINGVTSEYFAAYNCELLYGEFFGAMDNINRRQVVVLGHDIAEKLFPAGGALGSYVAIFRNQAKRYQVVGVLEEKDAVLGASFDSSVFIPFNTYEQRYRKQSYVSTYTVKVQDGVDATEVSDAIETYLDEVVGEDYYSVFSAASLVKMATEVMGALSSFLAAIAAISLLVGGIGIMNIMLVSVAERTREIGIRKALGASPGVIMGQFLCEAITLTIIGGILGVVFGAIVSYAIVSYAGWDLHLNLFAVLIAMSFSSFVGVFFGWYPAAKASRLDPIEALAHE